MGVQRDRSDVVRRGHPAHAGVVGHREHDPQARALVGVGADVRSVQAVERILEPIAGHRGEQSVAEGQRTDDERALAHRRPRPLRPGPRTTSTPSAAVTCPRAPGPPDEGRSRRQPQPPPPSGSHSKSSSGATSTSRAVAGSRPRSPPTTRGADDAPAPALMTTAVARASSSSDAGGPRAPRRAREPAGG